MIKRIYGKHLANYKWCQGDTAVINRTLEIYQTKNGMKAVLWNSGTKGWRGTTPLWESMLWNRMNFETPEQLMARLFDYVRERYNVTTKDIYLSEPSHEYGTISYKLW